MLLATNGEVGSPGNIARRARIGASQFPLDKVDGAVAMAIIVGLTGPSFRPVGSTMFVWGQGRRFGSVSSGCIDSDVALHALEAASTGPALLRYGEGSPYRDVRLPCGGSMDILTLPMPPTQIVDELCRKILQRQTFSISVGPCGASLSSGDGDYLLLEIIPEPRFVVFGKGLEAATFSDLAMNAGFDTVLMASDPALMSEIVTSGVKVFPFSGPLSLNLDRIDARTACLLFFHDHDLEPALLKRILQSKAFYIGAQGSRRTAATRIEQLRSLKIPERETARIRGPIGLFPSARDPRSLAVSVLAEVLNEAQCDHHVLSEHS
jgi:xanthine dehydrogenase accessory factor